MVDVLTGDANSACNKFGKRQEVQHPQMSAITYAIEGIVDSFNKANGDPLQHIRVSTEVAASKRSIINASLKHGSKSSLDVDDFYGVLDSLVTHVFHWAKTNRMYDCRKRNTPEDYKPDPELPLGSIYPDYKVGSGERYKLLTNEQLMLGTADTYWHHPLLVNLDTTHERESKYL